MVLFSLCSYLFLRRHLYHLINQIYKNDIKDDMSNNYAIQQINCCNCFTLFQMTLLMISQFCQTAKLVNRKLILMILVLNFAVFRLR